MKKKLVLFFLFLAFFSLSLSEANAWPWNNKEKPILIITDKNPKGEFGYDEKIINYEVFKKNQRIYFLIYNPKGFESNFIKYQIVKQDDKAHVGGYTRIRNITKRINDKYYYSDYIVLSEAGKYYLQIFDITNLHQWLAIGAFGVKDE